LLVGAYRSPPLLTPCYTLATTYRTASPGHVTVLGSPAATAPTAGSAPPPARPSGAVTSSRYSRLEKLGRAGRPGHHALSVFWPAILTWILIYIRKSLGHNGGMARVAATAFVGRRAELALLRHRLGDARAGAPVPLTILLGEAGVGKTRCLQTFLAGARD